MKNPSDEALSSTSNIYKTFTRLNLVNFSYTSIFSPAKWQNWVKKKKVLKEKCCLPVLKAATQKQCHSRADSNALPFLCNTVVLHQQNELHQKPKRRKREWNNFVSNVQVKGNEIKWFRVTNTPRRTINNRRCIAGSRLHKRSKWQKSCSSQCAQFLRYRRNLHLCANRFSKLSLLHQAMNAAKTIQGKYLYSQLNDSAKEMGKNNYLGIFAPLSSALSVIIQNKSLLSTTTKKEVTSWVKDELWE